MKNPTPITKRVAEAMALLWKPFSSSRYYIIFSFALLYGAEVLMNEGTDPNSVYPFTAHETLLDIYLFSVLFSFIPRKARHWVHGLAFMLLMACTLTDMFLLLRFRSHLTPTMLMLAMETDSREAGEFFSTYLNAELFSTYLVWPLIITLAYLLVRIRLILPKKAKAWVARKCRTDVEGSVMHTVKSRIKLFRNMLRNVFVKAVLGTAATAAMVWCFNLSLPNKLLTWDVMNMTSIGEVEHHLTKKEHLRTFNAPYRLIFSLQSNRLTGLQMDVLKETIAKTKIDSCAFRSPHIVLIIGEAYNKHHSQLYGYDRETTPEQLKMRNSGRLTPFTDVVSPWNLTSYVFKHIMTTYTVGDKGDWCDYPLIGNIFRKAGYHVTFLTNEFMSRPNEAVFDFSGGFFINDPKLSAEQFDARNTDLYYFDMGLLKDYHRLDNERRQKHLGDKGRLTIFHLMGQHNNYKQRCPEDKKVFKREDYNNRPELEKEWWKQDVCDYDNATRYNDTVIKEIVNLFKDEETIIIYMPDHGEEVHCKERPHLVGRFHSAEIDSLLAREEFEIPFWIYCSPKYTQAHPDIVSAVHASAAKPYMTDALPHLLMYLAGIKCPYYRDTLNILSPAYDCSRPRILKHQVDYDKIKASPTPSKGGVK